MSGCIELFIGIYALIGMHETWIYKDYQCQRPRVAILNKMQPRLGFSANGFGYYVRRYPDGEIRITVYRTYE